MTDAVERAMDIGQQFSNVAFNWAQNEGRQLTAADCAMLKDLQRQWDSARKDLRAHLTAQAARIEELEKDAIRYRWLRYNTGAGQSTVGSPVAFRLPNVPTKKGVNLMRGSVAQHLDAAIDAAMGAEGKP